MTGSTRRRGALLVLIGLLGLGAVVLLTSLGGGEDPAREPAAPPRAPSVGGGLLVFRSLDRGDPARYGRIAMTPLADRGAQRKISSLQCQRVHFAGRRGICLQQAGDALTVRLLGADFGARHKLRLRGTASRARVSPDGKYGSVTAFTGGHAYEGPRTFTTETTLLDLDTGRVLADLDSFELTRGGRPFHPHEANFWGVTFEPRGDRFYATVGTSRGQTYLLHGDLSDRQARVVRTNAECPSLAPNGTRVVYKKRVGRPPVWRYHVLDLRTGRETPLAETRPIDDQVEWLDNKGVLYRSGEEIWVVPANGRGSPRRYLAAAESPAVVQ